MSIFRLIPLNIEKRQKFIVNLHDSSFKGVWLRSLTAFLYANQQSYFANEKIYTICKEQFISFPVVVFAKKNFYLIEAINKKISIFQAAGLIKYWHHQAIDKRFQKSRGLKVPTMITVSHVSGCFVLLFGGLLISCIVFISEVFVRIFKKRARNF